MCDKKRSGKIIFLLIASALLERFDSCCDVQQEVVVLLHSLTRKEISTMKVKADNGNLSQHILAHSILLLRFQSLISPRF